MKGYVFPGQGAQFAGMGKDIYDKSSEAKKMFHQANLQMRRSPKKSGVEKHMF